MPALIAALLAAGYGDRTPVVPCRGPVETCDGHCDWLGLKTHLQQDGQIRGRARVGRFLDGFD